MRLDKLIIGTASCQGAGRDHNEDRYFAGQLASKGASARSLWLLMVADGIGGQNAGEVAAQVAVDTIREYIDHTTSRAYPRVLQKALEAANYAIYKQAHEQPDCKGMGATATVALIADGELYLAHVGDSRAYLIREGNIQLLTVDHTWVQAAVEGGRLTEEEAAEHPKRNVLMRSLGIQPDIEVDLRVYLGGGEDSERAQRNQGKELRLGDTLVLCTDGLSDALQAEEIKAVVMKHNAQRAAELLIEVGQAAQGGYDDMTVVIAHVPEAPRWLPLLYWRKLVVATCFHNKIPYLHDCPSLRISQHSYPLCPIEKSLKSRIIEAWQSVGIGIQ